MLAIVIFILLLGGLVLVHELGHFIAARLFGVGVDEFSIGFPPRLFSRQGKRTRWTLGILPLGGYVRIRGEDRQISENKDRTNFSSRGIGVRGAIIIAGVIGNLLMGVVILTVGGLVGMPTLISETLPQGAYSENNRYYLGSQEVDSPAQMAGLKPGDQFIKINGTSVDSFLTLRNVLVKNTDKPVVLTILRKGVIQDVSVVPRAGPDGARIGIEVAHIADVSYPILTAIRLSFIDTFNLARETVVFFVGTLKRIGTGGGVPTELRGPIGIAAMTGEVVATGWRALIPFAALITINLAVLNTLPVPALDGGRLFFLLIEALRRRPLKIIHEQRAHLVGFVLLIGLIFLVSYRDIVRVF